MAKTVDRHNRQFPWMRRTPRWDNFRFGQSGGREAGRLAIGVHGWVWPRAKEICYRSALHKDGETIGIEAIEAKRARRCKNAKTQKSKKPSGQAQKREKEIFRPPRTQSLCIVCIVCMELVPLPSTRVQDLSIGFAIYTWWNLTLILVKMLPNQNTLATKFCFLSFPPSIAKLDLSFYISHFL